MLRTRANCILAVLLVATFSSAALIIAARMKSAPGSSAVNTAGPAVISIQQRVQVVRFTLYDRGIYPPEARANPGAISISVEDLTGSSSGLLVEQVDVPARAPARIVNKAKNLLRSRAELVLPAGRYELTDADRRDNRALLIVDP